MAVPPPDVGQPLVVKGPHLRNDAYLANWTDDFIRVMKDAWVKLNQLLQQIEDRLLALEMRIADTYTYGQKGVLSLGVPVEGAPPPLNLLALPLRVVRDEEIVEMTAACETPSADTATQLQVQHVVGTTVGVVATLTLNPGVPFTTITLPTPRKMKLNEVLRVQILAASLTAADFVAQVRCR